MKIKLTAIDRQLSLSFVSGKGQSYKNLLCFISITHKKRPGTGTRFENYIQYERTSFSALLFFLLLLEVIFNHPLKESFQTLMISDYHQSTLPRMSNQIITLRQTRQA